MRRHVYRISSIRCCSYYFFCAWFCRSVCFCVATIREQRFFFFFWKVCRRQRQLDKVRTSETMMIARCCQKYTQPLSPAVSRKNESYNMNSPSASMVTHQKLFSHVRVLHILSSGYYLRAVFILFRASDCAATISGRHLFEEIL